MNNLEISCISDCRIPSPDIEVFIADRSRVVKVVSYSWFSTIFHYGVDHLSLWGGALKDREGIKWPDTRTCFEFFN